MTETEQQANGIIEAIDDSFENENWDAAPGYAWCVTVNQLNGHIATYKAHVDRLAWPNPDFR